MARKSGRSVREFEALIKAAASAGYRVRRISGSHLQLISPNPEHDIIVATDQSADRRAYKNTRARLRRQGLEV